MELLFDFIFEFLLDIGMEASQDKKVPKWIRYPLIGLFSMLFIFIVCICLAIGLTSLKTEPLLGTFLIFVGLFFLIGFFIKFKKEKKRRVSN